MSREKSSRRSSGLPLSSASRPAGGWSEWVGGRVCVLAERDNSGVPGHCKCEGPISLPQPCGVLPSSGFSPAAPARPARTCRGERETHVAVEAQHLQPRGTLQLSCQPLHAHLRGWGRRAVGDVTKERKHGHQTKRGQHMAHAAAATLLAAWPAPSVTPVEPQSPMSQETTTHSAGPLLTPLSSSKQSLRPSSARPCR